MLFPRNSAAFQFKCIFNSLHAQLRALLFVIKYKVVKMYGEGN